MTAWKTARTHCCRRQPSCAGDYELAYADNVNAGTATVTVKARDGSNYTGEMAKTFDIKKANPY